MIVRIVCPSSNIEETEYLRGLFFLLNEPPVMNRLYRYLV